jgi:hypothetical protein
MIPTTSNIRNFINSMTAGNMDLTTARPRTSSSREVSSWYGSNSRDSNNKGPVTAGTPVTMGTLWNASSRRDEEKRI